MVHGNQWATSTEISVATRILQSNINIWLQGRDGHNNICYTKEEYINSSLSRNVDLLLHLNHFKLLRDWPFNLKRGGYGFLFRSEFYFRTTQEFEYLFFLLRKARNFFQNLTLAYMTKTLNQIIFFSSIGNQNIFLEKKHTPPFKLNGRSLTALM
jgi:hypothetical protein